MERENIADSWVARVGFSSTLRVGYHLRHACVDLFIRIRQEYCIPVALAHLAPVNAEKL